MRRYMTAVVILLLTCAAHAESPSGAERTKIITGVIDQLRTSYIDVEHASKLEPVLRHADFSQAAGDEAFAEAVTALMQSVTKDQHLRLLYSAKRSSHPVTVLPHRPKSLNGRLAGKGIIMVSNASSVCPAISAISKLTISGMPPLRHRRSLQR